MRAGNDNGWSGWRNSASSAPYTPTPNVAQAQQSASLTATVNSDKSVDLTINNHTGNWWFKINSGSCTAVTGTTVSGISGYKPGMHTVYAYSDSNCATQIAWADFIIPSASLTATVNSDRSVDLSLSNGPSPWYFRIGWGWCTAVSGTTVNGISGYQAGVYAVAAFSGSGCKGLIGAANFIIPDPPRPTATLSTAVNSDLSVNLTLTNGPTDWWFRINWWDSCTAVSGTNTVSNIQGYKVGTHPVTAYSDSNCNTEIASSSFTISQLALAIAVDSSDRSIDLTLTGGPSNWWFRIGWWGNCTAATGTTVSNILGYQSGSYIVAVYPAAGCAFGSHITAESFTIPTATLTTTVNSDRSVDLTLTNGTSNWWFRINWWGACTAAPGTTVSNIQGYKPGTHHVSAYSDGGCKYHVASSSFTLLPPTLTASNVTGTGATLTIAEHPGDWYYKADAAPHTSCQGPVSNSSTKALTGLSPGTTYTYSAYSDSGCATLIATADSFTPGFSVSNLDETYSSTCGVGDRTGTTKCAIAFTTGSRTNGYTITSVSGSFVAKYGTVGDIVVAIHEPDTSNSSHPAATALATLSGSNPDTAGVHTWTCAWETEPGCDLDANATYFMVMTAPTTSVDFSYYRLQATGSNSEVTVPSGNGWSIADTGLGTVGSLGNWTPMTSNRTGMVRVIATEAPVRLTASSVTPTGATLALTGRTGAWSYQQTAPSTGTCANVASNTTATLTTLTAGTSYTYKAYSGSGCATANELASETFTTPASLTASSITSTGATLTIAGHTTQWYYKADVGPDNTCQGPVASGTSTKDLTGLTAGTAYTYSAYSDSGCATLIATADSFTTPASLTVSGVTKTVATLTLAHATHATNWSLKETAPSTGTCADKTSATHDLSSLTAGTTYTYQAYSGSGCTTGNELASETFTTLQTVTVSNLTETNAGVLTIGVSGGIKYQAGQAFTTGSNAGGYTLSSISGSFSAGIGDPGFQMKLHAASGSTPGAEITTATFSGSNPTSDGEHTFTCSGTGCALDASTTYFVVFSAPTATSPYRYLLKGTLSDTETLTPTGNGWSIANALAEQQGTGPWYVHGASHAAIIKVTAETK